ncbi:hypothetical protein [Streptacidiphilus jiangxiensis]|uniref:Uncharacterized protein n=1 Tax=Streptacidiphilus jiangxiensis TaxID=235985 RepID=A0A1H7ZY48_STRJI|nr:hypothetical protein [Streptacidiphilus jiangxiensis]SEM62419.1 hypothetical protein SAMN05414137_13834 [Streptacidiphilus jiangxiensis]
MGTTAGHVQTRILVGEDGGVAEPVLDVRITGDPGTVGRIAALVREAYAPILLGASSAAPQEHEVTEPRERSDGISRLELVSQDLALLDVIRRHVGTVYATAPDGDRASAHGTVRLVVVRQIDGPAAAD